MPYRLTAYAASMLTCTGEIFVQEGTCVVCAITQFVQTIDCRTCNLVTFPRYAANGASAIDCTLDKEMKMELMPRRKCRLPSAQVRTRRAGTWRGARRTGA